MASTLTRRLPCLSNAVFGLLGQHDDVSRFARQLNPLPPALTRTYLCKKDAVSKAAHTVRLPVFIDQSSDADEIELSRLILQATASSDKTQFVPTTHGVHGSATLRADRNAAGAEENMVAVLGFLRKFRAAR